MPQQTNNPYGNASAAYSNNKAAGLSDPRTLEAQVLLKSASRLDVLRTRMKQEGKLPLSEIMPDLEYNKKLWIVFADGAADSNHELPQEIKNNIGSLAIFMFKRTIDMMAEPKPEKLDVMIDINRQIASGLMKKPQEQPSAQEGEHVEEHGTEQSALTAPEASVSTPSLAENMVSDTASIEA